MLFPTEEEVLTIEMLYDKTISIDKDEKFENIKFTNRNCNTF